MMPRRRESKTQERADLRAAAGASRAMLWRGDGNATLTIVMLHGFSSNGAEMADKYDHMLPRASRRVYVNAPVRPIACYGGQRMRAWHDYHTDYGDRNVAREEVVDGPTLREARAELVELVRDLSKPDGALLLLGESQGGCVAIDVALHTGKPAVALFGQRYTLTQTDATHDARVFALVGGRDRIIPPSVALPSLRWPSASVVLARELDHAEIGPATARFLRHAVPAALLSRPSTRATPTRGPQSGGTLDTRWQTPA